MFEGRKKRKAAQSRQEGDDAKRLNRREFFRSAGAMAAAAGLLSACDSPATPAPAGGTAGGPATPLPPLPQETLVQVPGPYEEVPMTPTAPPDPAVLEFFTMHEARTVEALAATILPGDENDPGAREAGVLNYIDHLLAHRHGFAQAVYRRPPFAEPFVGEEPPQISVNGPEPLWVRADELPRYGYQSSLTPREIYRRGLELLDSYSRGRFGRNFAELSESDQEAVVQVMADSPGEIFPAAAQSGGQQSNGQAGGQSTGESSGQSAAGQPQGTQGGQEETGFHPPALREFFEVVRSHVIEGMFGDPLYGGNRDLVGWYLLGYPGAQRAYTPVEFATEGTVHRPQSIADMPHFNPGQPANEHVILPVSGSDRRDR